MKHELKSPNPSDPRTSRNLRNSRIPRGPLSLRVLLSLASIVAALFTLCGWSFGNGNDVKFVMDHHDRPVFFVARSIPKKLKPGTLVSNYQSGRWNGGELSSKGVKVAICDRGSLCYRLECQRTKTNGDCYDSSYTVTVPVYPDAPTNQQSELIAEGDAACADVAKFVQAFDDYREKDPYGERTTRYATGSLRVFGDSRIELYRRGRLIDALLFKSVGKVNLFSRIVDESWRTDFIVYADGKRYTVHDNGKNLIAVIEGNVIFYDDQGQFFATFADGVLRAYSDPRATPGKAISGVTAAKTVSVPTTNQHIPVKHYLAYMKSGQMYLADYLSLLWREGVPCGTKVPYKTLADLQAAIDAGRVFYDDLRLEFVEEATEAAA